MVLSMISCKIKEEKAYSKVEMKEYQSIRIFKNPLLERCTHVHPLTPLVIWGPVVLCFLWQALKLRLFFFEWVMVFISGLFSWTLIEYLMHRFFFHCSADSKIGRFLVQLFHGFHHDDPQDPTRLVMPPIPAVLILGLGCFWMHGMLPERYSFIFMASFLIGYLGYDYIHYATHHFSMKSRIGRFLKRHHFHHHFTDDSVKFGVSVPLWDYVFGTYKQSK